MEVTLEELHELYTIALRINADQSTQLERLKRQANDQQQEIAHCHATCDELRAKLDTIAELKKHADAIYEANMIGDHDDILFTAGNLAYCVSEMRSKAGQ